MRGLALATLFLGLCLIDPRAGLGLAALRMSTFLIALLLICLGI
jgi:hypothetical protein